MVEVVGAFVQRKNGPILSESFVEVGGTGMPPVR